MILVLVLLLASVIPSSPHSEKTSSIAAADGVPIHYSVQGKGEPALVFIHCWSCDRHLWDNQVPVFSTNHRVVTIDLPGHGEAGQGRKNWTVEGYADDVNAVITKLNLKQAVLIGSSMGGPIAVEAARRSPNRVVAIIPVDTLHNVENKVPPEQLDAVLKQLRADYKGAATGLLNQFFFSASTPAAVKTRIISEVTSRPPRILVHRSEVAEQFGNDLPFYVFLRPDNYIAFISLATSTTDVEKYLSEFVHGRSNG